MDNIDILYQNIKITESVLEIARILKPKKIINFSSIAVYPNKDGIYSELSETRPSVNTECLYGLSKYCSENLLDFFTRKENVIISHLRVAQVYGEGMREDRVISIMRNELRKNNTITVFGKGERTSNFIDIHKLLSIVEVFLTKDLPGIYNIGEKNMSYLDLARMLIKNYGNKNSKIIKKSSGLRVKFKLDTRKVEKLARLT